MRFSIRASVLASLIVATLTGCASTPQVDVRYYLPKSILKLELVRTLACDSNDNVVFVSTVIPTELHVSDREDGHTISLKSLDGPLSHSNSTFELYDDGRLKAINAKSTGQGASIIRSALSLISDTSSFSPFSVQPPTVTNGKPSTQKRACEYIREWGKGKTKVMTLKFEGNFEPTEEDSRTCTLNSSLQPTIDSQHHADQLALFIGPVTVTGEPLKEDCEPNCVPIEYVKDNRTEVTLKMREPAPIKVSVLMGVLGEHITAQSWSGIFPISQCGNEYEIPIPRAPLFGERTINLSVGPSGSVQKIAYTKKTGVGEAIGIGQHITNEFGTVARSRERLSLLKLRADLIAAQQRLAKCVAEPETCR